MLTAVLSGLLIVASGLSVAQEREDRLKAEFVERFTHFVTWPEKAPEGAWVIGVLGPSPMTRELERAFAERRLEERNIIVRRVSRVEDIEQCHVLYIPSSAAARVDSILEHTAHLPVLTISDREGLAERGVLVNFFRDGEYLRFEVNRSAVAASGLKLSSSLLRMARLVGEDSR